jgi:hypothetical protein
MSVNFFTGKAQLTDRTMPIFLKLFLLNFTYVAHTNHRQGRQTEWQRIFVRPPSCSFLSTKRSLKNKVYFSDVYYYTYYNFKGIN